jgi:hypothetical protein
MRRRIEKEILELGDRYGDVLTYQNGDKKEIIMRNKSIILKGGYPFEMPELYINGKEYLEYIQIKSERINNILETQFKLSCLCCSSLLCKNNWHPKNRLQDLMAEIDNLNITKQKIKNILYLDILRTKNNIINIVYNEIKSYL